MTDWEKRARELLPLGLLTERSIRDAALQLGREMAEEARKEAHHGDAFTPACLELCRKQAIAAADARAEEIAKLLAMAWTEQHGLTMWIEQTRAIEIARSTISKPKKPETIEDIERRADAGIDAEEREREWIRADERNKVAEAIAGRIDMVNVFSLVGRTTEELCAGIARSFITPKVSKTREQMLEEALRDIERFSDDEGSRSVARSVLGWKP